MKKMHVRRDDTVIVISGSDKDVIGKVLAVSPDEGKVIVEGVNVQKKHKKARTAQEVSSIENISGAIDASNVMVVCPVCEKATRVSYSVIEGKKVRVCKKCKAILDAGKEVKEAKKATKRKTKKAAAEEAEAN